MYISAYREREREREREIYIYIWMMREYYTNDREPNRTINGT